MPNWAPLADMPTISTAPRLAEMNASPVIHAGSERPERKKSRLSDTRRRAAKPMPSTTPQHATTRTQATNDAPSRSAVPTGRPSSSRRAGSGDPPRSGGRNGHEGARRSRTFPGEAVGDRGGHRGQPVGVDEGDHAAPEPAPDHPGAVRTAGQRGLDAGVQQR